MPPRSRPPITLDEPAPPPVDDADERIDKALAWIEATGWRPLSDRVDRALSVLATVESLPGSTGMHGECTKHRDCLAQRLRSILRGDVQ